MRLIGGGSIVVAGWLTFRLIAAQDDLAKALDREIELGRTVSNLTNEVEKANEYIGQVDQLRRQEAQQAMAAIAFERQRASAMESARRKADGQSAAWRAELAEMEKKYAALSDVLQHRVGPEFMRRFCQQRAADGSGRETGGACSASVPGTDAPAPGPVQPGE